MIFNKIERGGYSISVQHFPDRKRPLLCVQFPERQNMYVKVGEITNEEALAEALEGMFYDAEVIER